MTRKPITKVLDKPLYLSTTGTATGRGGWVMELRCVETDTLIATVDSDDLFDQNGNRFEYDVD